MEWLEWGRSLMLVHSQLDLKACMMPTTCLCLFFFFFCFPHDDRATAFGHIDTAERKPKAGTRKASSSGLLIKTAPFENSTRKLTGNDKNCWGVFSLPITNYLYVFTIKMAKLTQYFVLFVCKKNSESILVILVYSMIDIVLFTFLQRQNRFSGHPTF